MSANEKYDTFRFNELYAEYDKLNKEYNSERRKNIKRAKEEEKYIKLYNDFKLAKELIVSLNRSKRVFTKRFISDRAKALKIEVDNKWDEFCEERDKQMDNLRKNEEDKEEAKK